MAHKETAAPHAQKLSLPIMVVGPIEIGRLVREMGDIDEALLQLGIREGGQRTKMPQTSRLMDELIQHNKLNLLHDDDRKALTDYLVTLRQKAPVIHMSFSADPSAAFLEKLMSWLRREIHPDVLLTIGLQPNLGAGATMRTTNKYFDLSLRRDLAKKGDLLKDILRPAVKEAPA